MFQQVHFWPLPPMSGFVSHKMDPDGWDEDSQSRSKDMISWASLPDVCLRNVFKFLPIRDRVRANMVCHHWHRVMRSPSLWRYHYFRFNGRRHKYRQAEHITAVRYAHNLGKYLHRLEVDVLIGRFSAQTLRLERAIRRLFKELTRVKAQLQSLSLKGLQLQKPFWIKNTKNSLVESLINFLREGSSNLNSVTLTYMYNSLERGMRLLSTLCQTQRSISHLNLEHFFNCNIPVYQNNHLPEIIQQLQSLTDLTLDYSIVSDEMLTALSGSCLKNLSIHCCSTMPDCQVVNRDSWVNLTSKCPGLKVKIKVYQTNNTDILARMLHREIPLIEFAMTSFSSREEDWSPKPLLSVLLPQYSHSLQCVSLDLKNWNESIDAELLELVKISEHLEVLQVCAFLNIITLESILHHRLYNRSTINIIKFKVYTVRSNFQEVHDELDRMVACYICLPCELKFSAVIYSFY